MRGRARSLASVAFRLGARRFVELFPRALHERAGLLLHGIAEIALRERVTEQRCPAPVVHAERKGEDGPEREADEEHLELGHHGVPCFLKHSEQASARKAGWRAGILVAVLATGALAAEPQASPGWTYAIVAEDLPAVDNLAFDADGTLYATLELAREGRLVRLIAGRPQTVLGGLDRADGLRIRGSRAYLTEEVFDGRVLELDLKTGKTRTLARLQRPEGLAVLEDGGVLVTEDRKDGRLVQVSRNGAIKTLLGSLAKPEGIALSGDGTVYIAETRTGRILHYRNGERGVTLEGLNKPDQVAVAADGALWVTEDVQSGRLLRFANGRLETIVGRLVSPQGFAFAPDGRVMLAEQGRARILAVSRQPSP